MTNAQMSPHRSYLVRRWYEGREGSGEPILRLSARDLRTGAVRYFTDVPALTSFLERDARRDAGAASDDSVTASGLRDR